MGGLLPAWLPGLPLADMLRAECHVTRAGAGDSAAVHVRNRSQMHARFSLLMSPPSPGRSTCDGICGRVLAPLIKLLLQSAPAEGQACSQAVMGWCRHDCLWLRRTSVVTFVTLARLPDQQASPACFSLRRGTAAAAVNAKAAAAAALVPQQQPVRRCQPG